FRRNRAAEAIQIADGHAGDKEVLISDRDRELASALEARLYAEVGVLARRRDSRVEAPESAGGGAALVDAAEQVCDAVRAHPDNQARAWSRQSESVHDGMVEDVVDRER